MRAAFLTKPSDGAQDNGDYFSMLRIKRLHACPAVGRRLQVNDHVGRCHDRWYRIGKEAGGVMPSTFLGEFGKLRSGSASLLVAEKPDVSLSNVMCLMVFRHRRHCA
jgi:hypothetical protein